MRGHEKKRHCGNYKVSWPETEGLDKRITCEKCKLIVISRKYLFGTKKSPNLNLHNLIFYI